MNRQTADFQYALYPEHEKVWPLEFSPVHQILPRTLSISLDRQKDKSEANKSLYIFLTLSVCVLGNICLFFSVTWSLLYV